MGQMKDSGIEWIGEIPEKWTTKKSKNLIKFINGYAFDSEELLQEGEYPVIRIGDIKNGTISYEDCLYIKDNKGLEAYKIHKNDLLLAMSGATVGKVGVVSKEENAYINQRVAIIRSEVTRFIYYVLSTNSFLEYINLESVGSAQPNISSAGVGKFNIPCPSNEEQQLIANFLDDKVGKINDILADLYKQVGILQKYKKSLITKIVTKGLTTDAKMKDSGIEWIGKIPENWKIERLKYLTSLIIDGTHNTPNYVEEGIPFLRVTDITSDEGIDKCINLETVAKISLDEHMKLIRRCKPLKGDLLVSKNGTIGVPKIIDWDWEFSIFVSLCLIKMNKQLLNKYLYYYFKSDLIDTEIAFGGKTNTITNLHLEKIANFKIPIPNINEQQEIADFLDKKCAQIDALIADKQAQIEKMEKYKKSMIYEYVTGKKRVKGVEELYG